MLQRNTSLLLRVVGPPHRDLSFSDEAIITLGRSPENQVVLADARISGLHGRLIAREGAWLYEDLGSTNGSMIRQRSGRERVAEPSRPVPVEPGDVLLLGDVTTPVRIDLLEAPPSPAQETQLAQPVTRRSVHHVHDAGTALVNNPLTSRRVLQALFDLFRAIAAERSRERLLQRLLAFLLDNLREAQVAALFRAQGAALELEALSAADGARPSPPTSAVLMNLVRAPWTDGLSALIDDEAGLQRAFGRTARPLRSAIVAPLTGDGKPVGLLLVAAPRLLNQFDLDLLTVLTHHATTALENLALVERLQAAEARLRTENSWLKEVLKRDEVSVEIIGDSPALKRALKQAEVVARTDTTVLLLGETGTGKELFARYLHEAGKRRDHLFAAINCGALAETLLESELFGHKKGAFTGAHADRKGLFQVADHGTLFLDELGEVSPALQVKLLRVLETGEFTPVGAVKPERVDVRIIAATNRNLEAEVAARRFREDLYYRLNVFPIHLPSLRERSGDVPILASFFLDRFNRQLDKRLPGFSPEALERLRAWEWPGNVRELQNEIERAVLLTDDGQLIPPEALSERISGMVELPVEIGPLKETMARLEEQYIIRALREHGDNRTQTARTLGISRQALTVKLNRYGIIGNDNEHL